MDFGNAFGLMNPTGADPFAIGNLFRSNPDAAAAMLASTGTPPPSQGQGFGDWLQTAFGPPAQGASPLAAPGAGGQGEPMFPPMATPPRPGTPTAAGVASDVGSLFPGPPSGYFGQNQPPPPTAPAYGAPGQGGDALMQRTGLPEQLTPLNTQPIPGEPIPLPQARPEMPGSPLDITSDLQKTAQTPLGTQEAPKPYGNQLKDALAALKAPPRPESNILKASAPTLPHPAAMPKDAAAGIIAALTRQNPAQALLLSKALGGLR